MFVVAVARLGFDTSHVTSLKEKRSVRQQIVQRVKHRYPVAIAEIESNDIHSRLVLGLSVVSNSTRHAVSMMDKIIAFIDDLYVAPMEFREREILNLGILNEPFWELTADPVSWESLKEQTKELTDE